MFFVEGRLTAVLAALATAGGLAFCSTLGGPPADDPDWPGQPAAAAGQAVAAQAGAAAPAAIHWLADRRDDRPVSTPRN